MTVGFFRPDVECSCCRRASGSTTASVATVGLLQAQRQLLLPPLDCCRLNDSFCCHRWTAAGSTTASVATVGLLQAQRQLLLPPLDCCRLNDSFCCHRWTAAGSTTASVATVGLLQAQRQLLLPPLDCLRFWWHTYDLGETTVCVCKNCNVL